MKIPIWKRRPVVEVISISSSSHSVNVSMLHLNSVDMISYMSPVTCLLNPSQSSVDHVF